MSRPILVLQMQRMGDLILSFPLFMWLERAYPGRDIWVLAEKSFYEPLMPVSPRVTYMPWEGTGFLLKHSFELVLNLSIREQAARLAAEVRAENRLGPVLHQDGSRFVHGDWQLYRASLVRNNRYNRYHWAELNALDLIPRRRIASTTFPRPRTTHTDGPRAGLFLGASEPAKRPDPAFWAGLCARLEQLGIRPVLFGGPQERELGLAVRRAFGHPLPDLCGRFGLDQLIRAMHSLALFITPDTGPMHLAAWTGCRTLNLSMGNVNPWETGPYQPGHSVLRADMDCALGCWQCSRDRLHCHDPMTPQAVAGVAAGLMRTGRAPAPPGLCLAETSRERGLYDLSYSYNDMRRGSDHHLLADFWHSFFGWLLGSLPEEEPRAAARRLNEHAPETTGKLVAPLPGIIKTLATCLTRRTSAGLWESSPDCLRPLTGWADLLLQNEDFSRAGFERVLAAVESALELLREGA